VKLYRVPDWDQVWSALAHLNAVRSISWCGRVLATGSLDTAVKIISADTGATMRTLRGHAFWVLATGSFGDGTKILSGSPDRTVRVWRIFWSTERRVRGMMSGVEVREGDREMGEVCCEIVGRMKRMWEVDGDEEK
jgi:hypothetical protein